MEQELETLVNQGRRVPEGFYCGRNLLSKNCFFNMVIGSRNSGKTFWWKMYAVKRYLKDGCKSVYLRRYDTELQMIELSAFYKKILFESLFGKDNIEDYHKESNAMKCTIDITLKDGTLYEVEITRKGVRLNGDVIMYFVALSTWENMKSSDLENIYFIIFDECLIDSTSKHKHYIQNEINALMNLMLTVCRETADLVRIVALGNATSIHNPYFLYCGLKSIKDNGEVLMKSKDIYVEFINIDSRELHAQSTKGVSGFSKFIAGSTFEKMAYENKFLDQNDSIIDDNNRAKKSPWFIIHEDGRELYIWRLEDSETIYASLTKTFASKSIFTFDKSSVRAPIKFAKRGHTVSNIIRNKWEVSEIIYETYETESLMNKILLQIV